MARSLVITSYPSQRGKGVPLPVVAELRNDGVLEANACGPVLATFASQPASSTVAGTFARYMTNGVVTFDNLVVSGASGNAAITLECEEESAFVQRPVTWRVETGNTFTSPTVGKWVGVKEPSVGSTVWLLCTASGSGFFDMTEAVSHAGASALLTKPLASLEFRQVSTTFGGTPTPGQLGTLVSTLARVNRSRGWWAWWDGTTNPIPGLDPVGSIFCYRTPFGKIDLATGASIISDTTGAGTWVTGMGWSHSTGLIQFPLSVDQRNAIFPWQDGLTWHALVDYPTGVPSNNITCLFVGGASETDAENVLGSMYLTTTRVLRFMFEPGPAGANNSPNLDSPVDAAGWSQQRVLLSIRLVQNGGGAGVWRVNFYKNGVLTGFADTTQVPTGGASGSIYVRGSPISASEVWPANVAVSEASIRIAPESDVLTQARRCGVAP